MKKRRVVLNTEAHRPAFNDFADRMHAIENREGWRSSEVLRYWLDASFRAIRGRLLIGDAFDANEKEYMAIVKRCRAPQETMKNIAEMLGAVTLALDAEPIDFVGPVFAELSAAAEMGQFFTPHHLSYLIAKMTLGDRHDGPYVLCHEPACGVGGMVLAAAVAFRESGRCPAQQMHWHMQDVDFRAVCGAYIQTSLAGISGVVHCGNTLSKDPPWISAATPAAFLFPKRPKEPPVSAALPAPGAGPVEPLQFTLF